MFICGVEYMPCNPPQRNDICPLWQKPVLTGAFQTGKIPVHLNRRYINAPIIDLLLFSQKYFEIVSFVIVKKSEATSRVCRQNHSTCSRLVEL